MSAIASLAPTDLRDYLKSHGWSLLERAIQDRLYVLQHATLPQRQLTFPMDSSAPDYADSVHSVLEKLSTISGQTLSSIPDRIRCVRDDVVRLRVFSDGNDTTLPLSFASTLVDSTAKLLKAAACTVLRPRTHHPRLTLTEAAQFVDRARFGQTEGGSYVLQIACPLNAMEVQGSLNLGEETPFVRQVTLTLQRALSQLALAVETDRLVQLVDDLRASSAPLVSSNLCEALAGMHDDLVDNSLDVGFEWSLMKALPASFQPRSVRLQRDYFSRIEEVRRELRSIEANEAETYIGTVERLEGEMSDDGRRSGTVVLALLLPDEGEIVRARTVLNAADYAEADRAHMTNGAYVRVIGRLRSGRQPRQLTDMSAFGVLLNSATQ